LSTLKALEALSFGCGSAALSSSVSNKYLVAAPPR
jgi:predicted double-glycine peptidase